MSEFRAVVSTRWHREYMAGQQTDISPLCLCVCICVCVGGLSPAPHAHVGFQVGENPQPGELGIPTWDEAPPGSPEGCGPVDSQSPHLMR